MAHIDTNNSSYLIPGTAVLPGNATGQIPYGLTNDYMFRAVFQRSEKALRHLLSALLSIPYNDIRSCEIKNPIILGDNIDDKTCVLDIRLLLNDNHLINLEMQTGRFEFWPGRAIFYLSRLYCNIRSGKNYSQIKPALHIGILTNSPFPDVHEFYSEYLLTNTKNGHIFSRNFSARMLCLDQIDSTPPKERESELYYWAKLFKATTWEEVNALIKEKPYLNDAVSNLHALTEDEKIQLQCEARERYYLDMNSARSEGEQKGIQIGIKQGINQNKIEVARNLLDLLDAKTISEKVGLPLEVVQSLKMDQA